MAKASALPRGISLHRERNRARLTVAGRAVSLEMHSSLSEANAAATQANAQKARDTSLAPPEERAGTTRHFRAAAASVSVAMSLAACASATVEHGMTGDRAEFYHSIDDLVAASTTIVTARVTAREEVGDEVKDTIVTASVDSAYEPQNLGSAREWALTPLAPGNEVRIYQYGTADTASLAPILEPGEQYLLFLVRASDEENGYSAGNPRAGTFDIVGVDAGIYEASSDLVRSAPQAEDFAYTRANSESGDNLPEEVNPAEDLN